MTRYTKHLNGPYDDDRRVISSAIDVAGHKAINVIFFRKELRLKIKDTTFKWWNIYYDKEATEVAGLTEPVDDVAEVKSETEKRVEYRREALPLFSSRESHGIVKVIYVYKTKEARDADLRPSEPRDVTVTCRKKPRTLSWAVRQVERGRKVRRRAWSVNIFAITTVGGFYRIAEECVVATDWELAP